MKTLKRIAVTLMLIVSLFTPTFSAWAIDSDYVTENCPKLDLSPSEDDFLFAAEIGTESNFINDTIIIKDEHKYWIKMTIGNHTSSNVKDILVCPSISRITAQDSEISVSIVSSNANTLTDSIKFTASEGFKLEILPNSTFVYSWIDRKSTQMIPDSRAESGSFPIGTYSLDGELFSGTYVDVFFGIKVVRDSERAALYEAKKETVFYYYLLQNELDPNYFLGKEYHNQISARYGVTFKGKAYESIVKEAKKQTIDCDTDYQKMKALCVYLATTLYYDRPFVKGLKSTVDYRPYDVMKSRKTVCEGYSALYWTMLDTLGIPCILLKGENHKFNGAYDRDSKRWIIIDVTWCSRNFVNDEGKLENGPFNSEYFDIDLDSLLLLSNHELYSVGKDKPSISQSKVKVAVGKTAKIKIIAPQNASFSFSSKDNKIAKVTYNKSIGELVITGKKKGKTTVEIKSGSIKKCISVTVTGKKTSEIAQFQNRKAFLEPDAKAFGIENC